MDIYINGYHIKAHKFNMDILDQRNKSLKQISFEFTVTSETYHEVTTLLYQNEFLVKVPEENVVFNAKIRNYSTPIINLYEKGNKANYKIVLQEYQ